MKRTEALKLALGALEYVCRHYCSNIPEPVNSAITAIKEALAQPEQEPVAWMVYTLDGTSVCVTDNPADFTPEHRALPLYTTPPQRKPLTDEQIDAYFAEQWTGYNSYHDCFKDVIRWAEAAHGIKEST